MTFTNQVNSVFNLASSHDGFSSDNALNLLRVGQILPLWATSHRLGKELCIRAGHR